MSTGQCFGGYIIDQNFECLAHTREEAATHVFRHKSLIKKTRNILKNILFDDDINQSNSKFCAASLCSFNQGVKADGAHSPSEHNMCVDNNL